MKEWTQEKNLYFSTYKNIKYIIARNMRLGNLCGYVDYTNSDFPLELIDNIRCHGGLIYHGDNYLTGTYAEQVLNDFNTVQEYVNFLDNIKTIIGFDCAHTCDMLPNAPTFIEREQYRNVEYVENHCHHIIEQLNSFQVKYYMKIYKPAEFSEWTSANKYKVFDDYVGTDNKEDFLILKLAWK